MVGRMADLLIPLATLVFFLAMALYALFCERQ